MERFFRSQFEALRNTTEAMRAPTGIYCAIPIMTGDEMPVLQMARAGLASAVDPLKRRRLRQQDQFAERLEHPRGRGQRWLRDNDLKLFRASSGLCLLGRSGMATSHEAALEPQSHRKIVLICNVVGLLLNRGHFTFASSCV